MSKGKVTRTWMKPFSDEPNVQTRNVFVHVCTYKTGNIFSLQKMLFANVGLSSS